MRAVQLVAIGRPLEERHVPDPTPGPGEAVVDVTAAGVCRSDAHYRAGHPSVRGLPTTLGHEVAGVVSRLGDGPHEVGVGTRVAVHYLVGCGTCARCESDASHLCPQATMVGKDRAGGYAEHIVVPSRNMVPIPAEVSDAGAAVTMCSAATAWHAMRRARVGAGDALAVVGIGGLGHAAIALAALLGVARVVAIDIDPDKRDVAERLGAEFRLADGDDPLTGVSCDVTIDFVGSIPVLESALEHAPPGGRVVVVGLTSQSMSLRPYEELLVGERQLLGSSDHTRAELVELLDLAAGGRFDPDAAITHRTSLGADGINTALDALEHGSGRVRTVVDL